MDTSGVDDDDQPVETPRPTGAPEFLWDYDDTSRPAVPFLHGLLTNENRIGRDGASAPSNSTGSVSYCGDRETMLYLQAVGSGSRDMLNSIRNATQDNTVAPSITVDSFCFVESSNITNVSSFIDSMPEPRSALDLRLRYVETWTTGSDLPGIIEHVEASGEIDGAAALPDQHINPAPPEPEPVP
jgi:hypothetical protein